MAEPSIDVDRVVREVLAELGLAPRSDAAGGPPAEAEDARGGQTSAEKPSADGSGDLVLSCRVVTLSELEGRWATVRRLVVPSRAVITPAVRDELSRRNVTLVYASSAADDPAEAVRLVLVTVGRQPEPAALVAVLAKEAVDIEQHGFDCLIAATDRLAAEITRPHTLGLLLTRHTAAGLCLANRLPGARAVSGADAAAVATAAAAVGANLLVLDPAALTPAPLKRIVTEFCRAGPQPCPEVFRERLG